VNWNIWKPVIVSIPISIVIGLLLDPIKALLRLWAGKEAREKWTTRINQKTQHYINFPETFTQYLIITAIRLLATCAVGLVSLLIIIMIGLIAGVSAILNVPISPKDAQMFRTGLVLVGVSFDIALGAFMAQTAHCLFWWTTVRSTRDAQSRIWPK
jgi:uncharacterized Tic20 family protein